MEINLDHPLNLFNHHLLKQDNKNIVFSAPFGYGKTYFLNDYFKKNDKYRAFWLSPVNYVVGQNEDIFEYIKIDIALQLISLPELQLESRVNFSEDLLLDQYLKNKPKEVVSTLLKLVKELDIPIVKQGISVVENIIKAEEDYSKWKNEFHKATETSFNKLSTYVESSIHVKGSIFEDDVITQLIRITLQAINTEEIGVLLEKEISYEENVLIIDDFDRLDPEHIFRILNILSVHQNNSIYGNKFGFDKIMIVFSIDNIKNIYEHKYGQHVDFNGYMEKFYSTEIFRFDNQSAIAYYCQNNFGDDLNYEALKILGYILSFFVLNRKISIRSIIKHNRVSSVSPFEMGHYSLPKHIDSIENTYSYKRVGHETIHTKYVWGENYKNPIKSDVESFYIYSSDFDILKIIQILTTVFGDYRSLKKALAESKDTRLYFPDQYTKLFMSNFLPIIHFILNYGNEEELFAKQKTQQHKVSIYDSIETAPTYNLPETTVLNKPISIPVGWDEKNQYNGKGGYYRLAKFNFPDDMNYNEFKGPLSDQIVNFLQIILEYLQQKDFLRNIGISH